MLNKRVLQLEDALLHMDKEVAVLRKLVEGQMAFGVSSKQN